MAGEQPIVFTCAGDRLIGIVHHAPAAADLGVLVVVGGPQYRVGSHRLFVDLARGLAAAGVPAMRFDYRGMGDSDGDYRGFEHVTADIVAAAAAFHAAVPGLRRLVLWGLCDAASAIMMSADRLADVPEVVLVNPWVRSPATEARTILRHYYLMRLVDPAFWRKLMGGRVKPVAVVRDLVATIGRAAGRAPETGNEAGNEAAPEAANEPERPDLPPGTLLPRPPADTRPLPDRMVEGLERFPGRLLIVTSGRDLTAREFLDVVAASPRWQRRLAGASVDVRTFADCDHTFTSPTCRAAIIATSIDWVTACRSAHRAAEAAAGSPSGAAQP